MNALSSNRPIVHRRRRRRRTRRRSAICNSDVEDVVEYCRKLCFLSPRLDRRVVLIFKFETIRYDKTNSPAHCRPNSGTEMIKRLSAQKQSRAYTHTHTHKFTIYLRISNVSPLDLCTHQHQVQDISRHSNSIFKWLVVVV